MKHTEMIMVIEAHSEGKAIQVKRKDDDDWVDSKAPTFNFYDCDYRVKPEPEYRVKDVLRAGIGGGGISDRMVSISALADALDLVAFGLCDTEDYKALKELIK